MKNKKALLLFPGPSLNNLDSFDVSKFTLFGINRVGYFALQHDVRLDYYYNVHAGQKIFQEIQNELPETTCVTAINKYANNDKLLKLQFKLVLPENICDKRAFLNDNFATSLDDTFYNFGSSMAGMIQLALATGHDDLYFLGADGNEPPMLPTRLVSWGKDPGNTRFYNRPESLPKAAKMFILEDQYIISNFVNLAWYAWWVFIRNCIYEYDNQYYDNYDRFNLDIDAKTKNDLYMQELELVKLASKLYNFKITNLSRRSHIFKRCNN